MVMATYDNIFPQLLYQQMRSAYNAQKKPMDQMKDKVQQLLKVLGETSVELGKQPQKRPGNAGSKSQEPKINKKQKKNPVKSTIGDC